MTQDTSPGFEAALQAAIDQKTKPLGALGRIEDLAAQIARVQGTLTPRMARCQLTIFAADHGMAAAGVSAYPPQVTRQMVLNFATGGAAANVFARTAGVDLQVVNAGVIGGPFNLAGVTDLPMGEGTANAIEGPAMTQEQRDRALAHGQTIGAACDWQSMAFGEMGIGNTSAAALIGHKLTGLPLDRLIGRGTGVDDAGLARKRALLAQAAARTGALDAAGTLEHYGGFEIAMMAGAMIGAGRARRIVLVDGVIATAAALVAVRLAPDIRPALVFAHRSADAGHDALLQALEARPLLDLGLRLGEGTGALLAWPLLRAAAAMLTEMASFEQAGVSGRT